MESAAKGRRSPGREPHYTGMWTERSRLPTTSLLIRHNFLFARDPGRIKRATDRRLCWKSLLHLPCYRNTSCQLHFRTAPATGTRAIALLSRPSLQKGQKPRNRAYWERPMRRRRSSNRGSLRSGSSRGSTPARYIQSERARYPFSNQV